MDVFRTPDERFENLSGFEFSPHYLDLGGDLAGLRMHYVEEGAGAPVLLLHGEPTWAYLYRKMIGPLAEIGRVVAPDYIGFGRSDKVTDVGWYSYARHVDSIVQLIDELDLTGVTAVVQDWGGPIGLRVAISHAERFARIVMLNTGLFRPGPNWPGPAWLAIRDAAVADPDLPVGAMIQAATATDVGPEVLAGYEAPFPHVASKAGALAFWSLIPVVDDAPGAAEMAETRAELTRWSKPALVAFSDSDPIFPLWSGARWAERIPGAQPFVAIEGASHFLQEDKGERIAGLIASFVAST